MSKFLLVIPDGPGMRNFLCSGFPGLLLRSGEVAVWHGLPEEAIRPYEKSAPRGISYQPLPFWRESLTERLLRLAKGCAQLYWKREEGTRFILNQMTVPDQDPADLWIARLAKVLGRWCAGPRRMALLELWHARVVSASVHIGEFESFLAQVKPSVVLCAHQRSSRAVPALVAARGMGIPTATFIYSWDNLPKGRMAVRADHFLVWSPWMRQELLIYYPEVAPERVHVVGTPQFEPYFDLSLITPREPFLRGLGLDPGRPTVCFSGDDLATSPHDPIYLEDLAEALQAVPEEKRPQILFRRCPTDDGRRYQGVLSRHPEIAVCEPRWAMVSEGDWSQRAPTTEDSALLANVAAHCDAVVNVASTMALDFAILGKPAVYLAYDPPGWVPGQRSIHDIYRLPHFRCVHEFDPVHWARSSRGLGEIVMHALSHPEEKASAREAWKNKTALHPLDQASRRCCEALRRIAEGSGRCT
ncbi:MAG: hypothetical protein HY921_00105 [Elusimicrobia bacterium]|nr:hypothetical protein [Elusimicrobiota bacterium]